MLHSTSKYEIEDDGRSVEQMEKKILWLKNRKQFKESEAMLCVFGFKMRPVFVASKKLNAIM